MRIGQQVIVTSVDGKDLKNESFAPIKSGDLVSLSAFWLRRQSDGAVTLSEPKKKQKQSINTHN